jgi:hypothetical protein
MPPRATRDPVPRNRTGRGSGLSLPASPTGPLGPYADQQRLYEIDGKFLFST